MQQETTQVPDPTEAFGTRSPTQHPRRQNDVLDLLHRDNDTHTSFGGDENDQIRQYWTGLNNRS